MSELKSELCPYTGKKCTMEKCHAWGRLDGDTRLLADSVKWGEPDKSLGDVLIYHIYKEIRRESNGCLVLKRIISEGEIINVVDAWRDVYVDRCWGINYIILDEGIIIPPNPVKNHRGFQKISHGGGSGKWIR